MVISVELLRSVRTSFTISSNRPLFTLFPFGICIFSEIYCDDDISCKVTNACVDISNNDKNNGNDDDGGITLKIITNNEEYYQKLQQKLSKIMLQAWVCKNCNRHIKKIEKFINGNEQIWGSNSVSPAGATLSVGIDINNCGHHLGTLLYFTLLCFS